MEGEGRSHSERLTRLLKKPVVWFISLLIGAIGIVLTNLIVERGTEVIAPLTEHGAPVLVTDVSTYRSAAGDSVVLPKRTTFDAEDLAQLNASPDPVSWLEQRGGVAPSVVFIRMVLTGNRAEPVRILDVAVDKRCSAPLGGTLFLSPGAGAEASVRLRFNLDSTHPLPKLVTSSGQEMPFFPDRTISLTKSESQVVLVEASTSEQYCQFRLDLTVLAGAEKTIITVPDKNADPFRVTAKLDDSDYDRVYLGGVICRKFVLANTAYFRGDYANACSGNTPRAGPSGPQKPVSGVQVRADCQQAATRPREILVACGDGSYWLTNIQYTVWNPMRASGTATALANDFTPDRAHGKERSYRVSFILDKPVGSPGSRLFTRLTVTYLGRNPYGSATEIWSIGP